MKTIQEAGPTEIAALKRRTIRTLATGEINEQQCRYITDKLDVLSGYIESITTKEGDQ